MPKSTFLFKKGCLLSWLILIPFIIPAKVVLADYSCYWKNYGGDVCSGGYSTGSGNCSSSDVSSGCMDFYPDSYGGGAELVCDSCSYGCSNGSCNPAPTPTPTP
ncbi:MAG: hypothetical protein Q8N98_00440, partial [bacterium]|nr:hypothetical protein [bacterium]